MAISFSRPDPSSPAAVGAAQFTVGRRGFEQEEVRDFLRMVSAELARLQERERFLESELRTLQTQGISSPGVLDEETVMRVLGEETARVLTAAREAAHQMRLRASESADRIVREASADAARIRNDAEIEVSRQRADAIADAEAEIELAKQQGREMVAEARAYREKVLSELSRRRELAREQIEHLIHHRDRLATAFERARLAATDVVGDLDEFDELADEIEKGAGLMAGTGTPVFVDHTADPEAIPQRTIAAVDDGESTNETPEVEVVDVIETEVVVEEQIQEAAQSPVEVANESRQTAVMAEHPSTEQPTDHMAEVVQLFAPKKAEPSVKSVEKAEELASAVVEESSSEKPQMPRSKEKKSVDELFAKLREAKVEEVARTLSEPSTKPEPEVESTPIAPKARKIVVPPTNPALFEQRDSVLAPLNTTMTRAIKRVLADFENGSLTLLQSKKFVVSIDTLMPPADSMAQELVEAIADDMMNSALAGAQSVARGLKADLRKRVTKALVLQVISPQVAELIVNPLRSQIQRSIEQCDADKNEMSGLTRSAFRELKIQRVDAIVADLSCLAYSRGAYLAHTPGAMVCWMVDPNGPSCADAEDNSLAGPCPIGETFPTGHLHPICHAGCRCLLGPAT
jgi:cell division septum initiation protein DivIVA